MEVIKRARAVTTDLVVYKPRIKENSAFRSGHSSPSYVLMKFRYIYFCHQLTFFAINFHSPGDYLDILTAFIIWSKGMMYCDRIDYSKTQFLHTKSLTDDIKTKNF